MNSYETLLESFTEDQQMMVFNLMSIGNIDDPNFAAQILAEFDFNIDKAAQKIIDIQAGIDKGYSKGDKRMSVEGEAQAGLGKRTAKETEDLKLLYRRYLEKKMAEDEGSLVSESVRKGVNNMVSGVKNAWNNLIPVAIRGESTGGEQFMIYLRKNYETLSKRLKFNKGTFEENMEKAHDNKRPLLVYIHVDNPENKELTNEIFGDVDLMSLMNIEFYLLGLLADGESSQTVKQHINVGTDSCLAVFRTNLVDEIQLMESFNITNETDPKELIKKLKSVHGSFYILMLEEERIKQDVTRSVEAQRMHREFETYTNNPYFEEGAQYQNMEHYGVQPHFHAQPHDYIAEQQKLEDTRVLRQLQEEEYKEVERQIKEKQLKEEKEEAIQREKEEEEEQLKSVQAEERRKRDEERREQIKVKLQLLPKEPAENESNVISIAFRLPDGSRAERRFRTTDKAQALYLFIDTQDIVFDSAMIRYDIFQPRPFLCLDNLDKTLGEYFEGSNQEVVQIREHTA